MSGEQSFKKKRHEANERSKRESSWTAVAERSVDTAFESAASSKAPSPLRSAGAVHEDLVRCQSIDD